MNGDPEYSKPDWSERARSAQFDLARRADELRVVKVERDALAALVRVIGEQLKRVCDGSGIVSVVGGGAADEDVIAAGYQYNEWRKACGNGLD